MDGIQPYAGGPRPLVHVHPAGPSPASVKTPSDYLRAIRRRIALVLAVAIPLATAGTLYVLRMPATYLVTARIEVKAPKVDINIARIVSRGDLTAGGGDAADERYIPDTLAMLNDKGVAEETLFDRALGLPASALEGEAAAELASKIKYRQLPLSHLYDVTLEGRDPNRITRTLNLHIEKFKRRAARESGDANEMARSQASTMVTKLTEELKNLEKDLTEHVKNSTSLAPGGRSLTEAQYDMLRQRLGYQQDSATNLRRQAQLDSMRPAAPAHGDPASASRMEELLGARKNFSKRLAKAQRIAVEPSDPAIRLAKNELQEIEDQLAELKNQPGGPEGVSSTDIYRSILESANEDIQTTQGELTTVLAAMKNSMPDYHKYTTLMQDRENKSRQLTELKEKLAAFNMLSLTQKEPVKVWTDATEPTTPKSPNRPMYITVCIIMSLGLGLALVCFLEHIDHSVKVPEHLTMGLGLPLFGVVPRMLRNSRNHRGGHLWTSGTPDSIEADAYRNLRASLLGATPEKKPIVTLLVTSAKAGEGKSTTALNLAATCARAGERTLLMDVDLRRPSLNDVFPGSETRTGLVDVLRGDLPWQRTVVQTDLPNLDFLPTGDTRDVPIEVLGSLELRQLLLSLSEHHYDRVILDGPAVLGLADCRMLGRIVDGALMVVRSGSQELRPLQRAKTMLEQSQVHIVGVVFNGLVDDLQNWSSYGPNPMLESSPSYDDARPGAARGLGAQASSGAAALMASGQGGS
jgi:succinoglycan biosynthesis transport protein ExoP